uniref:GLOBIN domain-containing protein n=1 Tax=Panagrellus redivivus TaxID=6233 RepID=A0A7E4V922_PANRE
MAKMINTELLQDHARQYKLSKATAVEYHKQLFQLHPELAEPYNAEDLDPESLQRSQKFIIQGMSELQNFFALPTAFGDDRKWRNALVAFKEQYGDIGLSLEEFHKVTGAFLAAMNKNAGGVSNEQKKNWEELLTVAYESMKKYGWF